MQSYTQEYHNAISSTDRQVFGRLDFNNSLQIAGGGYVIDGEGGLVSIKVTQNAMQAERYCVGSVASAMCEASFFNYALEDSGVSLANSYFDAYIGVATDTTDDIGSQYKSHIVIDGVVYTFEADSVTLSAGFSTELTETPVGAPVTLTIDGNVFHGKRMAGEGLISAGYVQFDILPESTLQPTLVQNGAMITSRWKIENVPSGNHSISLSVSESVVEWKVMGRFYISEVTRGKDSTRIVGYDIAGRLSMDYVPTVTADPDNGYLVMDILNDIIDQTGVNGGEHFTDYGDEYYVTELFGGTCRDEWGWLCSLIGYDTSFTGSRSTGELGYMKGYAVPIDIAAYEIDETTTYMDGLSLGDEFTITSFTSGTTETPIVIGNGTGLYGLNPYMDEDIATEIEAHYDGYSYYPVTLHWRGDPCLDVLDTLSITQGEDSYLAICMKIETTFNGGLEQTITCWGDSEDYYAMSTSPTQEKLNVVSDLVHDIQQAIETADGGVITKILDTDGTWKELVIANSQDLDSATSVWRFNINGLAHSNRYQGGTYTLAMDTQGRIVANVIQTGILQDAQGNNSWNLDTGALAITNGSVNITTSDETDDIIQFNGDSRNEQGYGYTYHTQMQPLKFRAEGHFFTPTQVTTEHVGWADMNVSGGANGKLDLAVGEMSKEHIGYVNFANRLSLDGTGLYQHLWREYAGTDVTRFSLYSSGLTFYDSSGTQTGFLGADCNDYVVEQGTKSSWRYRKWKSKFYECWYTVSPSTKSFSAWGTVYASASSTAITYPTTFASVPWEFAIPSGGTNSVWLDRSGANTTTKSATYEGIRPTSGSANFGFILYVAGMSST